MNQYTDSPYHNSSLQGTITGGEALQQSDHFISWRKRQISASIRSILLSSVMLVFFAGAVFIVLKESESFSESAPFLYFGIFFVIPLLLLFSSIKTLVEVSKGVISNMEACTIKYKSPEFSHSRRYFIIVDSSVGEQHILMDKLTHSLIREGESVALFTLGGRKKYALPFTIKAETFSETDVFSENIEISSLPYFRTWKRNSLIGGVFFLIVILIFGITGLAVSREEPIGAIHLGYALFLSLFTIPFFSSLRMIRKVRDGDFTYKKIAVITEKEVIRKTRGTGKNRRRVTEYWITGSTGINTIQAKISSSLYYRVEQGVEMIFFSVDGKTLIAFPLD